MDKYISVEKLRAAFSADLQTLQSIDEHTMNLILLELDEAPMEDVAPVVHGKWINEGPYSSVGGDWMKLQECSVCHAVYTSHGNTPWSNHKYCPNCGAKMDGEEIN